MYLKIGRLISVEQTWRNIHRDGVGSDAIEIDRARRLVVPTFFSLRTLGTGFTAAEMISSVQTNSTSRANHALTNNLSNSKLDRALDDFASSLVLAVLRSGDDSILESLSTLQSVKLDGSCDLLDPYVCIHFTPFK